MWTRCLIWRGGFTSLLIWLAPIRLIPTVPRTNVPALDVAEGYPKINQDQLAAAVRLKKNVIIFATESMRIDDATDVRSPHLMNFVKV